MLLDTHVWLWFLAGDEKLGKRTIARIEGDPQSTLLSPISVWEALMLAQKGHLKIKGEPILHFRDALKQVPLKPAPLSHEVALMSRSVVTTHRDPADLFLVATAMVYDVPLATVDDRLLKIDGLKIADPRE